MRERRSRSTTAPPSTSPAVDAKESGEEFDYGQNAAQAVQPELKDIWQAITHMGIPQIDLDKGPSVYTVLDILYGMQRYRGNKRELIEPVLVTACQGKRMVYHTRFQLRQGHEEDRRVDDPS